jgi:DNA polymerase III epsilon subunit-like protein
MWLDHLPASVVFCDVETTGLGHHDRIVSFGGIGMISRDLANGRPGSAYIRYLVFNPGTENHRDAERIHGFSDSALRTPHSTSDSLIAR